MEFNELPVVIRDGSYFPAHTNARPSDIFISSFKKIIINESFIKFVGKKEKYLHWPEMEKIVLVERASYFGPPYAVSRYSRRILKFYCNGTVTRINVSSTNARYENAGTLVKQVEKYAKVEHVARPNYVPDWLRWVLFICVLFAASYLKAS